MNYQMSLTKMNTVSITGQIVVPISYDGETSFIMPDEIVHYCISQYGLLNKNFHVLDPMCGMGTIPRVINNKGGSCIGIEIDKNRFNMALELFNSPKIKCGNFLEEDLPQKPFNCIFTSLPFDWFKQQDYKVSESYAKKFKEVLTHDGFILLDSVPTVNRMGMQWPVALRQCDYLEKNGFILLEIIQFVAEPGTESLIMKFVNLA